MAARDAPPAKRRIPLWDNARFLAILLVVVGHAILRLTPADYTSSVLYLVIYSFHMPLLVLVSGYFAKASLDRKGLTRLVTDLAVPYLVFETIWTLVRWVVEGDLAVDYTRPSWTLWFLLALIGWRLLLPVLAVTRFPLVIAIVVSVGVGYLEGIDSTLSLARMLGLLPFFILGWRLRKATVRGRSVTDWWEDAPARVVRLVRLSAVALFAAVVIAAALGLERWRALRVRRFFLYDEAYSTIGYDQWWAGLLRIGVMALAVLLVVAFLTLLPRHATWYTTLGAATLYVYLLHTFFLYPLRVSGFIQANASLWLLVALLVYSAAITLLLSSPPARRLLRPLVEPRVPWLLARDGERVAR